MKKDQQLAEAVRGFFTRNESLCPEAMILEIKHVQDEHARNICEHAPLIDAKVTYYLLSDVCFLIQECFDCKKD